MGTKEKAIYATLGLAVAILILMGVGVGGIFGTKGTVDKIEELVACGETSEKCWTGNACMVTEKRKRCPQEDNSTDSHSHAQGGNWHKKKNCDQYYCTEPVQLADGSCCNENDFCYLSDWKKTCQSGMCVSKNYSLCKGSCVDDDSCDEYPIPISPNFVGTRENFCYWGTCITLVNVHHNYPNPLDLLNNAGSTNKSTIACVQGVCDLVGDVLVDEFPFQCTFTWKCSALNPQVVEPAKKRDISDFQLSRLGALHRKANGVARLSAQIEQVATTTHQTN